MKKRNTKKIRKSVLDNVASKHGIRYRGQTKREIADSLVGLRQKYLNQKEMEMIYPFATENKNKKMMKKTMKKQSWRE